MSDPFNTLDSFSAPSGAIHFASLKKLESALGVSVSRLPVSIRIVLGVVLRNCDGVKVTQSMSSSWRTGSPTPSAPRKSPSPWRV
jgi:aconitate hydratase